MLALLLIGLFLALEYAWLKSPRGPGRRRTPRAGVLSSGCPSDPAQRKDLGSTDYNWSLKALDGAQISFEQFRGKPIFLNVWATWCGPCVDEMPDIQALYHSMKQENAAFVLVSEESLDEVKSFVEEQKLDAPVFVSGGELPELFETRGIPATFIIDAQGTVVFRRTGAAGWNNDACRNFLRELLPPSTIPEQESARAR